MPASRRALIAMLVVVGLLTVAAYWYSHREIVVGRAMIGGPPPNVPHQNLVGRPVPSFSAMDQNGHAAGSSALHGRVAVINIWATWCKPCLQELPRFEHEVWTRFRPDVTLIAVARGESATKIRDFNAKANLTFSLVEDPDKSIAPRFGGDDAIPRTYVVNRSGVIVYQSLGYSDNNVRDIVAAVERAVAER